jgi:elongation factor P hydroxylase
MLTPGLYESTKNEGEDIVVARKKRKKAPRGYHYMPNGKLMKNSAHKKRKRRSK